MDEILVGVGYNTWCSECQGKFYSPKELGVDDVETFTLKRFSLSKIGIWSAKEYLPMGYVESMESAASTLFQIETRGSWQYEINTVYGTFSAGTSETSFLHSIQRYDFRPMA